MKLYKLLSFSFLLVTLTSCTFTENIYVSDNGTGKFSLDMDGSSLMAMAGDQLGDQLGADSKKNIDSSFTFKQLLADKQADIAKLSPEAQNEIKKVEDLTVNLKMNGEKKEFLMVFSRDFKNVNQINDVLQSLNALQKLGGESAATPFGSGLGDNNSTLSYTYDGKKFSRKVIIDKQKIVEKVKDSTAEMSKMVFASSSYVLKYHFPKRVKKVSNPAALFSEDRKTITIQYPFSDYMENPDKLNFDVEFEK